MKANILTTPVDSMVVLIKENDNCKISFLSSKLNLPLEIVERWLVILEEFKVLKIHYTGFEGFVKFIQPLNIEKKGDINLDKLKYLFLEKAKAQSMGFKKMKEVWPIFLQEYETQIKDLFFEKAKIAKYNIQTTQKAWSKYRIELEAF